MPMTGLHGVDVIRLDCVQPVQVFDFPCFHDGLMAYEIH
jgi:hypothetical protein